MTNERGQRIGSGHAAAWGRAGLKEVAQALQAFPAHGVQPIEEPGLAGNLTAQEVAAGKTREDTPGYEVTLSSRAAAATQRQEDRALER